MIVSTIPPIRSERADSSAIAADTSRDESATWRIASVACCADCTPFLGDRAGLLRVARGLLALAALSVAARAVSAAV